MMAFCSLRGLLSLLDCFCGPGYQTLISLDGMQAGVLKREKERMDLYRGEIGQR